MSTLDRLGSLEQRSVAVWKSNWLPLSETFVRDHVAGLSRWRAIPIGYARLAEGLEVAPEPFTPYGSLDFRSRWLRRLLGTRRFRDAYLAHCERHNVELIHAHFGTGGAESLPIAKWAGVPHITTFHGQDAAGFGRGGPIFEAAYSRRLTRLAQHDAVVLAVSQFVADQLVARGFPSDKIRVHYTGTHVPLEQPPSHNERRGVLFVGRLVEKKGVDDLLRAVSLLRARPVPRVVVIGDGPLRGSLQDLARELNVDARFLGWADPDEVGRQMRRSAVFCAPSRSTARENAEGFGMVYVEAALRGLPVVAYAAGGTLEATEPGVTALLAEQGDVQGLADALDALLASRERMEEMGKAGYLRAAALFDIRRQMKRLEEIYDSVTA